MSGRRTFAVTAGVVSFLAATVAFAANMTAIVDFFDGGSRPASYSPATVTVDEQPDIPSPVEPVEPVEPTESNDHVPEDFQGDWHGTIHQDGYAPSPVTVSITSGSLSSDVADVDYPELGCGGVWNLRAASDNALQVVEVLSYGDESCEDEVTIDLSLRSDGTVYYEIDSMRATGVLCRC